MHPPLFRPHPDCMDIVDQLVACHNDKPYAKFFGACNDAKIAVDACFKAEKNVIKQKNLERARANTAHFDEYMKNQRAIQAAKGEKVEDTASVGMWSFQNNAKETKET